MKEDKVLSNNIKPVNVYKNLNGQLISEIYTPKIDFNKNGPGVKWLDDNYKKDVNNANTGKDK